MSESDDLDRLYAAPPEEFIVGRDELARRLKADGNADAAKVKKLKRPSVAAALVNWLAIERRGDLAKLADALESLRDQATATDGKKLRAAVKKERELVAGLIAAAGEKLADRGGGSSATIDRVGETLRAIATDPELERSVLAGRLEKEGEASTIGFELPVTATTGPAKKSKGKLNAKKDRGPDLKAERAALKALRLQLDAAEEREEEMSERVARAEAKLATAEEGLAGAKADLKTVRVEHGKQERRLKKLSG